MTNIKEIEKAILLTKQSNFEAAKKIYLKLLEKSPDDAILLSLIGLFYVNIKNFNEAIKYLKKAYEKKETLGTVSAIGFAYFEQRNYKQAVIYLEKALALGENAVIYNKLIMSLFEIKSYKKAVEYSYKMYELYPENKNAIANKIKALTQSGKLLEAEELCINELKKDEKVSILWFHLGFLKELIYSDDKQAIECYKIASELGNPLADYNIAVSCQKLGQYKDAEEHYKRMLEKYPNDEETETSLGMCYLKQKRFKEGYDLFFKRDSLKLANITKNPWKPDNNIENEVIIYCDQGFGDHIQFIRYIPFLKGKNVKIAAPATLRSLFEKNYKDFDFINYNEINPEIQLIRISDLAYALNMDFDSIPFSEGYLDIESEEIVSNKPKIGLCWEAGSAGIRTMIHRTINVTCFEPLFKMRNIQLFSFQYEDTFGGNEKYPQMINLAKNFNSFEDTAKALKSMDILISVDTSVAHLAGALGVKTHLLLPYASDWRWFDDNKYTPWYKSFEIYKQVSSISWQAPIEEIINKLS